jgi:hypothetical protein
MDLGYYLVSVAVEPGSNLVLLFLVVMLACLLILINPSCIWIDSFLFALAGLLASGVPWYTGTNRYQ